MSIATEITRLTTLRDGIRGKLMNLGIVSNSSATLSDCYTELKKVKKYDVSGNTTLNATVVSKFYVPGYYTNPHGAEHVTVNIPDPTITVGGDGVITASGSWTAGFTSDTSYSASAQLNTQAGKVWFPTTTDQTIPAQKFLTGIQTIKGDANLIAGNIINGKTIFGVSGDYGYSSIGSYINVKYPSGSTCSCTNGTVTIPCVNTSGATSFAIPSAGSWTVSCTDGTDTASNSITVAASTIYSVDLSYDLRLYMNGDEYTSITGGWNGVIGGPYGHVTRKAPRVTKTDAYIRLDNNPNGLFVEDNSITLTDYNTFTIDYEMVTAQSNGAYHKWYIVPEENYDKTTNQKYADANAAIASTPSNLTVGRHTFSIDISSLVGNYYMVLFLYGSATDVKIYSLICTK